MAYTPKTQKNNTNPLQFLNSFEDSQKKEDSLKLLKFFQEKTNEEGNMWRESIIGFGEFHYKTKSNYDWFRVGFSPRKSYLSLYCSLFRRATRTHTTHWKSKHWKKLYQY